MLATMPSIGAATFVNERSRSAFCSATLSSSIWRAASTRCASSTLMLACACTTPALALATEATAWSRAAVAASSVACEP
ncbi:hypothetical protein D3C87_1816840 [compost metagenome]